LIVNGWHILAVNSRNRSRFFMYVLRFWCVFYP